MSQSAHPVEEILLFKWKPGYSSEQSSRILSLGFTESMLQQREEHNQGKTDCYCKMMRDRKEAKKGRDGAWENGNKHSRVRTTVHRGKSIAQVQRLHCGRLLPSPNFIVSVHGISSAAPSPPSPISTSNRNNHHLTPKDKQSEVPLNLSPSAVFPAVKPTGLEELMRNGESKVLTVQHATFLHP